MSTLFDTVAQVVSIISGVATIGIVFLLWKTVRDMQETTKLSKIQLEHRFRPWIGPSTGIELMKSVDGKQQFVIAIKNYGEIPASNVVAKSAIRKEMPNRDDVAKMDRMNCFNLGPLLPAMEKRYWFFVDSNALGQVKEPTDESNGQVYAILHFKYYFPGGESGYGMISQFDPKSGLFVHKEMWID